MPCEVRPASYRRCATVLAAGGLALAVAVAPLRADASVPRLAGAPLSTGVSPGGPKLRTIMRLVQEPTPAPTADPDAPVGVPVTDPNTPGGPADPTAPGAAPSPAPAPTVDLSAAPLGPPPRRGLGMLITGASITGGFALPMLGYGAYGLVVSQRIADDGARDLGRLTATVILAFGMVGLAVGGPLLGVGAYRFSRYQRWKNGQQVWSPAVNRTAHGTWTTGVSLRF